MKPIEVRVVLYVLCKARKLEQSFDNTVETSKVNT